MAPKRMLRRRKRPDLESRRLIARAQRGENAALELLVRRNWASAYRVGYLITQSRETAEDIAQEAVLGAVGSLDRFDRNRPFGPWLARIAAHKAHDWVRRQGRRPEAILEDELAETETENRVADEIVRDFGETQVGRALARLDLPQREAVVLRHLLDFEPQEIAEIVGVPASTVRTRIFRGLARLRTDLLSQEKEDVDERTG